MIIQDMESDASGSNIFKMNHLVYGEFYCYTQIFQEILQRFKLMTLKHEKVLFERFELYLPGGYHHNERADYDGSNKEISQFFRLLKEEIYSAGMNVQYVWVREQHIDIPLQHYHCMLLVNINDGEEWNLSGTISGLWSRIFESGLEGLVVPRNYDGLGREIDNGILITRPYSPDVMSEVDDHLKVQFDFVYSSCISWAIDLARVNHTSVTPRRIRRFGVS